MYLQSLLEAEHSKAQMQSIVAYIGHDQKKFDLLMQLFLNGEYRIVQRAAWPLSNCAQHSPALVKKYIKTLINCMKDSKKHPAVRRNILRIFDLISLPKKYHGEIMTACINYIANPNEAIAAQAFSLGILKKFTQIYPEIRPEIEAIIENRLPNAPAAFCTRARKYLKK